MSTLAQPVPRIRKPAIPSSILGMLIFIATELMFFTALISAFVVIKKERVTWALPETIQLPVVATGFNTFLLLMSGAFLIYAGFKVAQSEMGLARSWTLRSLLLGSSFLALQGYEWVQLIGFGLTMKSSIFGALFFLIIGAHGIHVLAGVIALAFTLVKMGRDQVTLSDFRAMQMYWSLVVLVWPLLYYMVYF